jgi:hypothetical protein
MIETINHGLNVPKLEDNHVMMMIYSKQLQLNIILDRKRLEGIKRRSAGSVLIDLGKISPIWSHAHPSVHVRETKFTQAPTPPPGFRDRFDIFVLVVKKTWQINKNAAPDFHLLLLPKLGTDRRYRFFFNYYY